MPSSTSFDGQLDTLQMKNRKIDMASVDTVSFMHAYNKERLLAQTFVTHFFRHVRKSVEIRIYVVLDNLSYKALLCNGRRTYFSENIEYFPKKIFILLY